MNALTIQCAVNIIPYHRNPDTGIKMQIGMKILSINGNHWNTNKIISGIQQEENQYGIRQAERDVCV